MKRLLLLTGWLGYVGSHAVVAFEQAGYTTLIIDNLSNSSQEILQGIKKILGYIPVFLEGDICDVSFLEKVFSLYSFDGVIHFAGLKAVWESTQNIASYHKNNIFWSMTLFEVMEKHGVKNMVFSSSATVYDVSNAPEYKENNSLGTSNPYGTTKLVIEKLLEDYARHANWSVVSLRYFNPIGAHPSWYIGEQPNGVPNNLLPYIFEVASGKREFLAVFWDDYDTPDGTGVRDYIDINDLVEAHILAFTKLHTWYIAINIGTGAGKSVLEMIHVSKKVTGKNISDMVLPQRNGDIAEFYANTSFAKSYLWWEAKTSLEKSIENGWKFHISAK